MSTQPEVTTPREDTELSAAQAKRKYVFERVARLNGRHRSVSDVEKFFDSEFSCYALPADRCRLALAYFVEVLIAEMFFKVQHGGDSWQLEKLEAAKEVCGLLEALYRDEQAALSRTIVRLRLRTDQALGRSPEDRLREDTFKRIAKITGKSTKTVERTFNALDWHAFANDRTNVIRENLFADVPEAPFYPREPRNQAEHTRRRLEAENAEVAREYAKEAMRETVLLFQHLHAELNRPNSRRRSAA